MMRRIALGWLAAPLLLAWVGLDTTLLVMAVVPALLLLALQPRLAWFDRISGFTTAALEARSSKTARAGAEKEVEEQEGEDGAHGGQSARKTSSPALLSGTMSTPAFSSRQWSAAAFRPWPSSLGAEPSAS